MLLSSIRDFLTASKVYTAFQLYAWTGPRRLNTERIAHPTQCAWRSSKSFIAQSQADERNDSRRFLSFVYLLYKVELYGQRVILFHKF